MVSNIPALLETFLVWMISDSKGISSSLVSSTAVTHDLGLPESGQIKAVIAIYFLTINFVGLFPR